MSTKPKVTAITATSADVINAIRNSASQNFRDYVPAATADATTIRGIGNIIMQNPTLQNEFVESLVNRIGRVIVNSKMYSNPWSFFKKGIMDFGESVEELFVQLIQPFEFDPAVAESEVFKRSNPAIKAAFHVLNYKKFYKVTVSNEQLRQAFLSVEGVNDLVARIAEQIATSVNYDEFQVMKYMLARHIINGHIYVAYYGSASPTIAAKAEKVKEISNKMEYMSTTYNLAGVRNFAMKDNQYLISSASFDAKMDVNVLASAFHMEKAEFMGHRVGVDGFGILDNDRLDELMGYDSTTQTYTQPDYEKISDSTVISNLNAIDAVLVDGDFMQIWDNLIEYDQLRNPQGLYWNWYQHTWKTFSISPFANAALFNATDASITSVTVSPSTASVVRGQTVHLSASVVTGGFANKAVDWKLCTDTSGTAYAGSGGSYIDNSGNLVIGASETTQTLYAFATSVVDSTKSSYCTVTVTNYNA